MIKVAITGGIGSGKSTLCRAFARGGVPIYNADNEAKRLMRESVTLREAIIKEFSTEAYDDAGELNRKYLSEVVFKDESKLSALNKIVHPAVMRDFEMWSMIHSESAPYVILESAILFESKFNRAMNLTVAVLAPQELRVQRVVNRDGASEEQVRARMVAQLSDEEFSERCDYTVVNIVEEDMDDAAKYLDQIFKYESSKS